MYYPVCGMVHTKEILLLIGNVAYVAVYGFLSRFMSGPLTYIRRHRTVNKIC